MAKPTVPRGLKPKAQRLWRDTVAVYDLRPDELRILEDACREVDIVEKIHARLSRENLLVEGSMGQAVAHPLLQEIRHHRMVTQRLLAGLKLPDGGAEMTEAERAAQRSTSAREAANARWHGSSGA